MSNNIHVNWWDVITHPNQNDPYIYFANDTDKCILFKESLYLD